jgi:hypothetical protein
MNERLTVESKLWIAFSVAGLAAFASLLTLVLVSISHSRLTARIDKLEGEPTSQVPFVMPDKLRVRSIEIVDSRGNRRAEILVQERTEHQLDSARFALYDAHNKGMIVAEEGSQSSQLFLRQDALDGVAIIADPALGGEVRLSGPLNDLGIPDTSRRIRADE